MTPAEVVQDITQSGLRGRGGAGYPTGLKWATVAKMPPGQKYIICNADEGDPGAFMDRSVLESDPHRILEGMAIAGYAVGATQGYIYVRAEYPLAITRLQKAIQQAKRKHCLGAQIFDSPVDFSVEIRVGGRRLRLWRRNRPHRLRRRRTRQSPSSSPLSRRLRPPRLSHPHQQR